MVIEDMGLGELVVVIVVAIAIAIFIFLLSPPKSNIRMEPPKPSPELISVLERELKSKDVVLYGASWCGYTVKQLNEIGGKDSVTYFDCADENEKAKCEAEGIEAYPTWKINGQTYSGYYNAETLVQMLR